MKMIVKNRFDDTDFDLDNIVEFYGQAELTNRLLDHEPGVDPETAEAH